MGVEFPWLNGARYVCLSKWAGLYNEKGKYLNVNRGYGFFGFQVELEFGRKLQKSNWKPDDKEG